jgi:hypothetical protein
MTIENTARKLGTPDAARTGIHLVYSRNWTYQQRLQMPLASKADRQQPVVEHQRQFSLGLMFTAAVLIVPGVWAIHSVLHSLHLM